MNKRTKNNGITLISLVITIIIMLILVGVSITLAVKGGLFGYAGNAVGDMKNAMDEENTIGNGGIQIDGEVYSSIEEYLAKDKNPGELEKISENEYEINSIEDLVALAYSVNSGEDKYLGKTIKLGRDLDFEDNKSYVNPNAKYVLESPVLGYTPNEETGTSIKELMLGEYGFVPIGAQQSLPFYGSIEGNNKVIKNMKIALVAQGGLIGYLNSNEEININNLGIVDAFIECYGYTGAIVGYLTATGGSCDVNITNCYNTGNVKSLYGPAGGLIGYIHAEGDTNIKECWNTGTIEGPAGSAGICVSVGTLNMVGCYNEGSISSSNWSAGGLVCTPGKNSKITLCMNRGKVSSTTNAASGICR